MTPRTALAHHSSRDLPTLRCNKRKRSDDTIQHHVATLEKLAANNGGYIPSYKWLNAHGYFSSYNVMKDYPEAFAHLKSESEKKFEIYKSHNSGKPGFIPPANVKTLADYDVPGASFNPSSLAVQNGLTEKEWMNLGRAISHVEASSRWWVGDWLLAGYRTFGKSVTNDLAQQATSYERTYLYATCYVAKRFPPERRVDALSFYHHEVLAPFPPETADELLAMAVELGLTARQIKAEAEKKHPQKGKLRGLRPAIKVFLQQEIEDKLVDHAEGMPLGFFIAQVVEEWLTGKPVERYENGRRTKASKARLEEALNG